MISKDDINTLKLVSETLNMLSDCLIGKPLSETEFKSISIQIINEFHLVDKNEAERLAKEINIDLFQDRQLHKKISSLTEEDMRANNTFIVYEETSVGSHIYVVWTGS
jgi:hypothetical protein